MAINIIGFIIIGIGAVCNIVRYIVSGEYARKKRIRTALKNPDLSEEEKIPYLVAYLLDTPFAIQ